MDNPFDQFDATQAAASANPFDQFDAKDAVPNPFEDKPEPGVLSRVGSAIAGGARTGFQDLLTSGRQNTAAVTGDKVEAAPPDTDPRAAPIDWFSLPSMSGVEKGVYQATKGLVSGAPEMAGALAGAGLGTAAVGGPEDPLAALAAPVGAALGAGGVSALRSFYPLYAEEKAKGLGDDEAWAAAKSRAIRDGLVTGAAFGLFEARPVFGAVKGLLSDTYSQATTAAAKKAAMDQAVQSTAVGPVRNVAEQALVVQPGAAAAGQVANNAVEGKPLGENVANAAGSAAIGTVVPMGAHLAGSAAIGKAKDAPAAEAPTRPGPGRGAADQAVGVAGAPSEKIAGVLNSNPAVEIEKAAERGKEAAQEAAPPAEAPVEPAAPPAEATPLETPSAEGPAPEAPPATPAEAVADAAQHGTEEAQALLSPAFTEPKIRDTTGAVPAAQPAAPAEAPEPAAPSAAPQSARIIRQDTAVTPGGREVPVDYAVVEASDLVPSHLPDGRLNPDYPQEIQPRDRTRATSQQQINEIAARPNARLLGESPLATDGAPIIGPDGVVESGNGRSIGLRKAYADGTAEGYRSALAEAGYPVEGMKQPVLVRINRAGMGMEDRAAFAREANERTTLGMSSTERAMSDAKTMPGHLMDLYRGGDLTAAANRDFMRAFIRDVVSKADQGGMIAPDGSLSQEGVRRAQSAVLAKAYGDEALTRTLTESADNDIKALGGALMDVSGQWAQMRSEAATGQIDPRVDATQHLMEAVKLVQRARADGRALAEFVGQSDMFAGRTISPEAEAFLRMMFRDEKLTKPIGRDKISDRLAYYADEARKAQPGPSLFGDASVEPSGILRNASKRGTTDAGEQADIFAQPSAERVQPGDGAGGAEGDRSGQGVPEAPGGQGSVESGRVAAKPPRKKPSKTAAAREKPGLKAAPEAEAPAHSLPDADRPPSLADEAVRARVVAALLDRLKVLGLDGKIGLTVEQALEAVVNGETVAPNGRYFQKVIEVAMDAEGGVSRAFDHEVLHGLKDLGVFTDGEWNALSRIAESKWIKQYGIDTKPGYRELPKAKQIEEAIAHAFSDSEAVKYGGLIGRAIRNGRNLIEAIGNAMRGNGFTSARSLFDRVRAGDLADRTAVEAAHSLRDNGGNPVPVPDNSLRDRILRNPLVKRAANTSVAKSGAEYTKGMLDDFVMKATPMAIGSERAQATAKDFANDMRSVQDKYGQIDRMLTDHYTPAERSLMGSAIDEQSVMEQEGNIVPGKGLDRLTPDQRATATMLNDIAKQVWKGLYDAGIVTSPDGLPSYMPRMFVSVGDDGSVERLQGDGPGAGPINSIGRNLSTSGPQKRNHLTAAESEAAAKAKFGDSTTLVTDIRALPLALARSERSIAGRKLVDTIKKIGDQIGQETTADAEKPGFFTIDHPALKTYSHEKVGDEWVLTKKSLYISQEFEGPLRAVLSQKSGHLYNALMAFKGAATSLIMISPFIHNMVEWGRALPLLPGKVITGMIYFEGNRAKNDPALRAEAVRNGLVPIGQSHHADITGIAEDPQLAPGRSLPAKAIGAAAEAIGLGKNAADAVRRGIDKAGEFWHGTLLWDRIGDLQFGIYKNMKDKLAKEGMDAQTAGRTAAHLANRYAGALPAEAASNIARKAANLTFFSRSFTFGNIGVMKDVLNGLPRDVRAQISRDVGALNAGIAAKVASKAAMHAFLIDVGMFYGANALLQSGFSAMRGDESLDEIGKGYVDRVLGLLNRVKEHPLEALNPFGMAEKLTPNSQNEPGKEDRAYVGRDRDGTGIYLRNPVGKVGEEFRGWLTSPLEMFKRKESTLLRPAMEVLQNDKGFGRKVYDADDKTVAGMFRAAGDIAWHIMGSQLPLPSLEAASNLALGQGSQTINTLKTVGPLVGLSFSKGAPGGPENGLMFAEQTRARNAKVAAMPDVNKLIDAGKTDEAVQKMVDLGMSRGEIAGHLKYREVPEARINAGSLRRFYGSATPDEKEKMERLLSRRP